VKLNVLNIPWGINKMCIRMKLNKNYSGDFLKCYFTSSTVWGSEVAKELNREEKQAQ
jgi:hypothetical protein